MLKKKSTKALMLILTILIVTLATVIFFETRDREQPVQLTTKQIGPYTVNANQTEFQKKVEESLLAALDTNEASEIIPEVAKYFVSDFFTLRDKENYNNVGGLGFILPDIEEKFRTNAINSFYRDLPSFVEAFGNENLPLVTSVSVGEPIKVENNLIKVSKEVKIESAYDISVEWIYEENENLGNIITQATLRFVLTDDIWYVYEIIGK